MDQPTSPPEERTASDVLEELRELGRNLKDLMQSIWESEERKKLERELETGLNEAYISLSKAAQEFTESPTGQTLKSELEALGQRIRSGEVETQVRSEILAALRSANEGLRKAIQKPDASAPGKADPADEQKEAE